jgi:catechol 2,3-dioxygenase-like lactoylglutathione lyase family enzyme
MNVVPMGTRRPAIFDHVELRASSHDASERFYDLVLPVVGGAKTHSGEDFAEWGDFSVFAAGADRPVTKRVHVGFFAVSPEVVDEFWRVGTEAGYASDGVPGPRPEYSEDYYGGFLLDPDGNSIEAVTHGRTKEAGAIDHIWVRVADVAATRTFYATIAPYGGFTLADDTAERVRFAGESGSFSFVQGEPTQHLHWAFPASDNSTVDAFHAAATNAGYRDNGAPGERVAYHPGYYGAFVLDPDGNNVEVVNHNR